MSHYLATAASDAPITADVSPEQIEEACTLIRSEPDAPRQASSWKAVAAGILVFSAVTAVAAAVGRPVVHRNLERMGRSVQLKQQRYPQLDQSAGQWQGFYPAVEGDVADSQTYEEQEDDSEVDITEADDEWLTPEKKLELNQGDIPGDYEHGVIYPGNALRYVTDIHNEKVCANLCAEDEECLAWSFAKKKDRPWSNNCYIRGDTPKDKLPRVQDDEFVSGMPTHKGRHIDTYDPAPGQSLFCFALFIPWSNEKELIQYVYDQKTHIFQCEEYSTYSDGQYLVAPAVRTVKVDSDLKCESGGEFGTALNTPIFNAVWDVVISGGRYAKHDWTVKTDPDCVFFPDRLRAIVARNSEYQGGTYLNNCRMGLHGPLEVLSKLAVDTWKNGRPDCERHFQEACAGDCQWGEDIFIDQCLQYLGAYRVDEFEQLIEDHCDPPDNWDTCLDDRKTIAAFHPFKTKEAYAECMEHALSPPNLR